MANASRKKIGAGSQGKGAGAGAMTTTPDDLVQENQVLANRDKKTRSDDRRSDDRGQDGKAIQTEQRQDHAHNRLPPDGEG